MKKLLYLLPALILFSCGTTKYPSNSIIIGPSENNTENIEKVEENVTVNNIISFAKTFEGTRYKFGGTDENGMDCSGLVYRSFLKENITLPRVSRDMANEGVSVNLGAVEKGDLLFFKTNPKNNRINHVGLIVEINNGIIKFIHSTNSLGVIISSLEERYWKKAFVSARKII